METPAKMKADIVKRTQTVFVKSFLSGLIVSSMVNYPVKNQKIFLFKRWTHQFAADRLNYSDGVCYNYGRQASPMIREMMRYVL